MSNSFSQAFSNLWSSQAQMTHEEQEFSNLAETSITELQDSNDVPHSHFKEPSHLWPSKPPNTSNVSFGSEFDSEASFSESFLQKAGATLLASLEDQKATPSQNTETYITYPLETPRPTKPNSNISLSFDQSSDDDDTSASISHFFLQQGQLPASNENEPLDQNPQNQVLEVNDADLSFPSHRSLEQNVPASDVSILSRHSDQILEPSLPSTALPATPAQPDSSHFVLPSAKSPKQHQPATLPHSSTPVKASPPLNARSQINGLKLPAMPAVFPVFTLIQPPLSIPQFAGTSPATPATPTRAVNESDLNSSSASRLFATPEWNGGSPPASSIKRFVPDIDTFPTLAQMLHNESLPGKELGQVGDVVSQCIQLDGIHRQRHDLVVARLKDTESRFEHVNDALQKKTQEAELLRQTNERSLSQMKELRDTLRQAMSEIKENSQKIEEKEREFEQLLLQSTSGHQVGQNGDQQLLQLQQELDQERRARAAEKRDYEIRIEAFRNQPIQDGDQRPNDLGEDEKQQLIQQVREQTRSACQKDFEVRKEVEQRELKSTIAAHEIHIQELERRIQEQTQPTAVSGDLSSSLSVQEKKSKIELEQRIQTLSDEAEQRQAYVKDLETGLNDAFQENERLQTDVRSITMALSLDRQEIQVLKNKVQEMTLASQCAEKDCEEKLSKSEQERASLVDKLQALTLASQHAEKDWEEKLSKSEQERAILVDQLRNVETQLSEQQQEHEKAVVQLSTSEQERASLFDELRNVEARLSEQQQEHEKTVEQLQQIQSQPSHLPEGDQDPIANNSVQSPETQLVDLTPLQTRIKQLEKEVSKRGIQIAKLSKAKNALEDENTNFSVALSAKQLELSMLKRNARMALKQVKPPHVAADTDATTWPTSETATSRTVKEKPMTDVVAPKPKPKPIRDPLPIQRKTALSIMNSKPIATILVDKRTDVAARLAKRRSEASARRQAFQVT